MTTCTNPFLVELDHLTFGYGERVILRDVSFGVPRGKVTALMGVSGGGKTTVLRLIGGQIQAQQGQVRFDGQNVSTMHQGELYAARRRMGMLFQFGALFTDISVFDNVAFPLREHTTLSEDMVRDIVLMKLDAVGLRGARDLKPAEISGGMSRRVALARALAAPATTSRQRWSGLGVLAVLVGLNIVVIDQQFPRGQGGNAYRRGSAAYA